MPYELRSLIAQTHLAEAGFYKGRLDGLWGPLSRDAADDWEDAELLKALPRSDAAAAAVTPFSLARQYIGTREIPGKKHNSLIVRWGRLAKTWFAEDETPWCSAFVNAMAREAGYEHTGALNARSWMDIGVPVDLLKAKEGDVVIFWRVAEDSWEGHVGFFSSFDARRGKLNILGGNQRNMVSLAAYTTEQLLGIRRLRPLDQLQGNTTAVL